MVNATEGSREDFLEGKGLVDANVTFFAEDEQRSAGFFAVLAKKELSEVCED